MERERAKEEYLEALWYMAESQNDSFDEFKGEAAGDFSEEMVDELVADNLVEKQAGKISLTETGHKTARQLIRSHRIAERLVHDVLGVEFEKGACEFEHIVNADLVDSICTLLGHPRECPHGMPIPEGQCCTQQVQVVESTVVSLDQLELGEEAKIAYVYAPNDQQMHRLDNLLIRPGMKVKLHQRYPSFVIDCENSVIALDEQVATNIHVWINNERKQSIHPHGRRKARRGLGHSV